nr:hypothetical protein Itr_chr11CG14500 [Ipomoea trifida]
MLGIKDIVSSSKEGLEIIYEVIKVPVVLFENNSQRWSQTRGSPLPSKVGNSSPVNHVAGMGAVGCNSVVSGAAWALREVVTTVVAVFCNAKKECTIWERLATVSINESTATVVAVVCDAKKECTIWERLATVSISESTATQRSSSFSMDVCIARTSSWSFLISPILTLGNGTKMLCSRAKARVTGRLGLLRLSMLRDKFEEQG